MNKECYILQPGKLGDILICAPIARFYAKKGYKVYGTSRDPLNTNKSNLERLGIK